jgi:hypothetical protein
MPEFRLMWTSGTSDALVWNLERRLSSVHAGFVFYVHPRAVEIPKAGQQSLRGSDLETLALKLARRLYPREIPVLITAYEIDDGAFCSFDDTVAVIGTHHWGCPPQILHIALKMKEVFHKVGE